MDTEIPANAYVPLVTAKDHIDWWNEVIGRIKKQTPTVSKKQVVLYKRTKW